MTSPRVDPPFAVIDFEASSLSLSAWPELSSYPIEVGVAIADEGGTVRVWSSLIRPDAVWKTAGEWNRKSERAHGITREALDAGASPVEVASRLEAALAAFETIWCDNARYDRHWLTVLYATAGMAPSFELRDVSEVLNRDRSALDRYRVRTEQGPTEHRAGPDAERICAALLAAFGSESEL